MKHFYRRHEIIGRELRDETNPRIPGILNIFRPWLLQGESLPGERNARIVRATNFFG
jgi:hypothetical protein